MERLFIRSGLFFFNTQMKHQVNCQGCSLRDNWSNYWPLLSHHQWVFSLWIIINCEPSLSIMNHAEAWIVMNQFLTSIPGIPRHWYVHHDSSISSHESAGSVPLAVRTTRCAPLRKRSSNDATQLTQLPRTPRRTQASFGNPKYYPSDARLSRASAPKGEPFALPMMKGERGLVAGWMLNNGWLNG